MREDPSWWLISLEWIKQKDFVLLREDGLIFSILFQWSKKAALKLFLLINSFIRLAFLYFLKILKPDILSIFNLELTPSLKFSSKVSSFIWAFSILISGSREFGSKSLWWLLLSIMKLWW